MITMRNFCLTMVVLLSLPLEALGRVSSFSLDNGMQVVVIEDHRAPVITHMVWYRAGASDEKLGKSGVAHLLHPQACRPRRAMRIDRRRKRRHRVGRRATES